jgi:uncharacterized protein
MFEVGHMAINADDVDATRAFYESVCGWHFEAWGPRGFHRAELPGGFTVAIQQRRELIPGSPTIGAEATIMVNDVAACVERAEAAGGQALMPPTQIQGVGTVAFVADPGGNPIGLMQHR